MAAGWLPWSKGLARKLEVLRIAQLTGWHRRLVAATLMEFWEWADDETEDGSLPGMDVRNLSALHADTGDEFWSAVIAVGWLERREGGLFVPHFDYWMGMSAKRRLKDTKRKGENRQQKPAKSVRKMSASEADKKRTTEQNRIEDPPNPPAGGTPAAPAERGDVKRQRKRTPDTMPPGDDLLAALVEVTASDPRAASSHLSRACKALRDADPPYTASDVRALPEILRARGFTLPLTVGTVLKYIGWVRRPPAAAASSGPSLDDLARQAAQRRQALESSRSRQDDGPQPLSRLIPGLNGQATEGQEDRHAR